MGRHELPYISFPLNTAMNNVIQTPVGETPPSMKESFSETDESRSARKSSDDANDWSLNHTYSMSFSAESIDLVSWKVLYPYDINLSLFWGTSPLRLVIYESVADNADGEAYRDFKTETTQDLNNYLFALQVRLLG